MSYITGCQTCCNTHAHCSHTMLSTMRFCRTAETASCGISLCSSAGRKNIERMLHVLFRRGNRARVESTWRRLQTNQRGLVHRSTERSNKMEDSTRTSLLFFRSTLSVCHVYLSSLEQQQGETVYPRSRRCAIRESNPWLTAGCHKQGMQSLVWLTLHADTQAHGGLCRSCHIIEHVLNII